MRLSNMFSACSMLCRNVAVVFKMARLMWFLAARHSQLTHLTRYHHALYFKKIAQAGHKRNYSNEIYNRENVNQVLGLKNFGASVTFSQDERKQTFMAASLSSRNYFQRGVKGLYLVIKLQNVSLYPMASAKYLFYQNFVFCQPKQ